MARKDYVVEGAILECTLGTTPGEMMVTSQQKLKIKSKLKATSDDKMLKPPFFGSCMCSSPNPPCAPILKNWKETSKRATMGDKTFLTANSKITCEKGGLITIKNVGQDLVGTGKQELELDEKYPELKGEIIFANGYLSESLGGVLNAIFDNNPDKGDQSNPRGHNMNEADRIDEQDILLSREIEEINNMTPEEIEADRKSKDITITYPTLELKEFTFPYPLMMSPLNPTIIPIKIKAPVLKNESKDIDIPIIAKKIPQFTKKELKSRFRGYWNSFQNDFKGSQTYANYFNAENNEHFLNGSHGLGSNAAHRIDHGIAQGYHWATYQWGIISKAEVDDAKDKVPYIESYSPAYKPITVVMHSQGNAPGVGFALGAMKYAQELGWDQIPLNLVFLSVNQPKNLWGEEYTKLIDFKVKYYGVDKDFLHGSPTSILYDRSYKVDPSFSNALSELFDLNLNKLRHKRGIYEHLQAITDFDAIKERSVQFTFCNDRGDLVIRDGDIPEIDCACNPKGDNSLYSVEFYGKNVEIPAYYSSDQGKEIIALEHGNLIVPSHAAIPRLEVEINETTGKQELKTWEDYRSVAIDWGNAFGEYKNVLRKNNLKWSDVFWINRKVKEINLKRYHREMLYNYGRIQMADLYAHFSPVSLIFNENLLKNKDFNDEYGNKNIWERIKKAGEHKFYRVEYGADSSEMESENEIVKRKRARDFVVNDGKKFMINTSIANNTYIQNVIDVYIHGNSAKAKDLYEETELSNKEIELSNLFTEAMNKTPEERAQQKIDDLNEINRQNQVKKDAINTINPIKYMPNDTFDKVYSEKMNKMMGQMYNQEFFKETTDQEKE